MRERTIEQYLRLAVKAKGGLALKFTSPGMRGVPDRLVLAPDGRVYFIELKATGRQLSPMQVKMHETLKRLGHNTWVIDSVKKIEGFIDEI